MAVTNYYVDPGATVDTGSGTKGSPWAPRSDGTAAVQYALNQITAGANGDQINVKSGSTDTLNAALDFTSYGTPTATAKLCIKGYTTDEDDGGIGVIDGAATYSIINSATIDHITFADMKLGNCGSASVLVMDIWCNLLRCEIHTSSNATMVTVDNNGSVVGCWFHTFTGATQCLNANSTVVCNNFFDMGTSAAKAVDVGANAVVTGNIFKHNHVSAVSVDWSSYVAYIANNSCYNAAAGTSQALYGAAGNAAECVIINNIIEGWSGAGGNGINFNNANASAIIANNWFYNCTTNISGLDEGPWINEDNSTLTASAFNAPGSDDFTASTEVKEGAFNQVFKGATSSTNKLDAGACQRLESSGGGGGKFGHA